ncbi:MAG: hypothetical protein U9N31_02120 [Candidatus Marinimicrobia bacterium]|nr:hypothetical protein [Candidatus Neomarinimicrobiota bacterium]
MKFAKWLYNLSGTDQLIILAVFGIGLGLSYFTILVLRLWHERVHGGSKYSHEMRVTPFGLIGIAAIYSTILYMSIGETVTKWIIEITQ